MQSETRLRPSQLVWCQPCHWCDGIGGVVRLELLSLGHFLQEKAWDVLGHEPPPSVWRMSHPNLMGFIKSAPPAKQGQLMTLMWMYSGTLQKNNMALHGCYGPNTASLPPTQVPGLGTVDLDWALHLFSAWWHRHLQSVKHCKETNKDLLEKKTDSLTWRFSEITV